MKTLDHDVVIVGAGPTGMMLAAELELAGIDVLVVERRANTDLPGSRALGLHSRTLEIFDQRGIVDRFLARGQKGQHAGFSGIMFDISGFPVRHNYGLAIPQQTTEIILAEWLEELGVRVVRGFEVRECSQDDDGVTLVGEERRVRARYAVGCDGGGSVIRKSAGIDFAGTEPSISNIIAEGRFGQEPQWGIRRNATGIHGIGKIGETGLARILVTEREVHHSGNPSPEELSAALVSVYGTDFGVHDITWLSRFTDMARQAVAYRDRRVLIAGDAAHVHPPDGGMGIQTGVQDAVNLGWKLAQVVHGSSPGALLDTYHAERHPVAAKVLRQTLASVALRREDDRTKALRETLAELLSVEQARTQMAASLTGLDVRYDVGTVAELAEFALLGRRMPDIDVHTVEGARRVHSLMHDARPLLLMFGDPISAAVPWSARVKLLTARQASAWQLPVVGAIEPPSAVFVRPDGHVAWVGGQGEARLEEALAAWCGPTG